MKDRLGSIGLIPLEGDNKGRIIWKIPEATSTVDQSPPKNVRRIYHYTSLSNWRKIQQAGVLEPNTFLYGWSFLHPEIEEIVDNNQEIYTKQYITGGVDSANFQQWRDYGLHDRLLDHVSKNEDQIILLSFPASAVRGALIRDHAHTSPIKLKEAYGDKQTFKERYSMEISQMVLYHTSTVRGIKYDGSFKVPEIWIPHSVSISDITVEKVGKVSDFR